VSHFDAVCTFNVVKSDRSETQTTTLFIGINIIFLRLFLFTPPR